MDKKSILPIENENRKRDSSGFSKYVRPVTLIIVLLFLLICSIVSNVSVQFILRDLYSKLSAAEHKLYDYEHGLAAGVTTERPKDLISSSSKTDRSWTTPAAVPTKTTPLPFRTATGAARYKRHANAKISDFLAEDPMDATLIYNPDCELDVLFILDRSESVNEQNVVQIRSFVKQTVQKMIDTIPVKGVNAKEGLQFAIVGYNTNATVLCNFNQSTSEAAVMNCIDNFQYYPGLTDTGLALEVAEQQVLVPSAGDRPNVKDLIILITDGAFTAGTADPVPIAERIRQNGTRIFGVGVAGLNGPNRTAFKSELDHITGNPAYVFNVSSYAALTKEVGSKVVDLVNCTRKCYANVQFILEATELVSKYGWDFEREAMYEIIQASNLTAQTLYGNNPHLSAKSNYYGMNYFSSKAKTQIAFPPAAWTLDQIKALSNPLNFSINGVQGGECNLDAGIQMGAEGLNLSEYRNQDPIINFVVLMAEGFYDMGNPPYYTADILRTDFMKTGGEVFAIGEGPRKYRPSLNFIATGDAQNWSNYFDKTNYTQIAKRIQERLTSLKCGPLPPPPTQCVMNCFEPTTPDWAYTGTPTASSCPTTCPRPNPQSILTMDLAILIDFSKGISSIGLASVTNFLSNVFLPPLTLDQKTNGARVLLMTYSSYATQRNSFDTFTSLKAYQASLKSLTTDYFPSSSSTSDLSLALTQLNNPSSLPDAVLLFTASNPTDLATSQAAAKQLGKPIIVVPMDLTESSNNDISSIVRDISSIPNDRSLIPMANPIAQNHFDSLNTDIKMAFQCISGAYR